MLDDFVLTQRTIKNNEFNFFENSFQRLKAQEKIWFKCILIKNNEEADCVFCAFVHEHDQNAYCNTLSAKKVHRIRYLFQFKNNT